MLRLAASIATALLLLAGCTSSDSGGTSGDDDGGTGSSSSPDKPKSSATKAPTGPDCADVWKAGVTLPKDYSTCVADGAYGVQEVTKCQDGTRLVAFADTYYAVTGGTIAKPDVAPMQDTEAYSLAYAACAGE